MKKSMLLMLVFCLLFAAAGCGGHGQNLPIEKTVFFLAVEDAVKVQLMSGNTGKSVEITDATGVKKVTEAVAGAEYELKGKVDFDGWSYNIRWYDSDGVELANISIAGSDTLISEGYYYTAPEGSGADTAVLDGFF